MSEKLPLPEDEETFERMKHRLELLDHNKNGVNKMRRMVMDLYFGEQGVEQ